MLKFVRFEFERHIEFVLDCIEEARPLNWPGAARTRLARTVDYEFFRTIDTNKHCISLLSLRNKTIGFVWYDIEFNTIEGQKYCHLDFIYLLPEFRGRGYGKYVMPKSCIRRAPISLEKSRPAVVRYTVLASVSMTPASFFHPPCPAPRQV